MNITPTAADRRLARIKRQHDEAIRGLSPQQQKAVHRLLVATVANMVTMKNRHDMDPEAQAVNAQAILHVIMRDESEGKPMPQIDMWNFENLEGATVGAPH